jgi:two-component system sensor histidine kinase DctS
VPPHADHPPASAGGGHPASRRWVLLGATLLLVVALLAVLIFLAAEYEETRDQAELEADAAELVNDVRGGLLRNVQTLQSLLGLASTEDEWMQAAAGVLHERREMLRLEWRDDLLHLRAGRDTPYLADLFEQMGRADATHHVRQACDNALRLSGPAYSPSYFWPLPGGHGLELIEMCMPVVRAGYSLGYLVVTYSLSGVLAEMVNRDLVRGRGLAFTDADGTRLALYSSVPVRRRVQSAAHLMDLQGATLVLRLESPRPVYTLFPNVLSAVVGLLSLLLLVVLGALAADIRRRQRVESELAEALAFRKAMEDSLVTGLRARDMEHRVTYVNPAFCEMVGYSAEQLIGTGLPAPWWPPERVDEYTQRQAVRLAGRDLPRQGWESEFMRSDGTRFPVLIIEAPLIDARGVQTGWMSAIIDLTEQRRIEQLNRASQERLQATARLAAMGEMASTLSHELNQPLAAIASYATGADNLLDQILRQYAATGGGAAPWPLADMRQAIARIREQAERAGRVIRSVADFVRRREGTRESVSPAQLFEAIAPLVQLQAKRLDVRVRTEIAPDCPNVICDRTMVEQVLLNLVRNGMQAMPPDEPPLASGLRMLTLAARPVRPLAGVEGMAQGLRQWVEFAVTDHGVGLTPEVAEKLFTPFFTTRPEGMGLGLSLCRTVVEQHGGALTHEPARPRGTVFRFTLPVG